MAVTRIAVTQLVHRSDGELASRGRLLVGSRACQLYLWLRKKRSAINYFGLVPIAVLDRQGFALLLLRVLADFRT
jgi:hypothetical protein